MGTYRSRRPDDEEPRRRRRDEDDEDDEEDRHRPHRRRPRRKSRGSGAGLILGIVGGVVGVAAVVVVVVLVTRGKPDGAGGGGNLLVPGRANISYARFKEIRSGATLEGLEPQFGQAMKLERAEWGQVRIETGPPDGPRTQTLATLSRNGVESWYRWKNGPEEIYVGGRRDNTGRTLLVMKVYLNPNAADVNARHVNEPDKWVASHEIMPLNW